MTLLPATIDKANAPLPETYEYARLALAECEEVDECKDWSDKAVALASYARQADDQEILNFAKRIRARAVRRMGELLKEFQGPRGPAPEFTPPGGGKLPRTQREAAEKAGLSRKQEDTARSVSEIPEEEFEEAIEGPTPANVKQLAEMGRHRDENGVSTRRQAHLAGAFEKRVASLLAACQAASELTVPALEKERCRELVQELHGAATNVHKLRKALEAKCQN